MVDPQYTKRSIAIEYKGVRSSIQNTFFVAFHHGQIGKKPPVAMLLYPGDLTTLNQNLLELYPEYTCICVHFPLLYIHDYFKNNFPNVKC